MNLPGKEQLHHILGRIWAWWKKDFVVSGEAVGPRWWYLMIIVIYALLELILDTP
jgi:hypothetical protein